MHFKYVSLVVGETKASDLRLELSRIALIVGSFEDTVLKILNEMTSRY